MLIPNQEKEVNTRKLSIKSLLGCGNRQVKRSTQIAFALVTGFLFASLLTTVIMQAIILDIELDENYSGQSSESSSDENSYDDSEKCFTRTCHVFCLNLSTTKLIEIGIKTAVKELRMCVDISLVLQFVNFDKKILPIYWLEDLNKPVSRVQIFGGNLQYISPHAFKSETFTNLELVFLNALKTMYLDEHSFAGINNLQQLTITQIESLVLTKNTFKSLKTSLRTLSIETCGAWDPRIISSQILSNVDSAYFRFNDFKTKHLGQLSLRAVKSSQLLNLASSNIVSLQIGTFDEFKNLLYINLNNNNLQTLPPNVFDRLTANNIYVTFDLHINPWHCDCQLDFLRKLATNNYTMTTPLCSAPKRFYNLAFNSIQSFCIYNDTDYYASANNFDLNPEYNFNTPTSCNIISSLQRFNPIDEYSTIISTNSADGSTEFYIVDEQQSSITISFTGNLNGNYNFFWFPFPSGSSVPDTVNCIPRVKGDVVLEDIHHSIYLFCLMEETETIITSSHCKVHIRRSQGVSLSWLTISQQSTVIIIFSLSILSCLLLAACSVYLALRNNPAVLRASNRVIKVRCRTGEAYITPTKLHKMIPTELKDTRRDRKSSKISTSSCTSGGTYISTIETTNSQLDSWRARKASYSSQSKSTSPCTINKGEYQLNVRTKPISDYLEETDVNFKNERVGIPMANII